MLFILLKNQFLSEFLNFLFKIINYFFSFKFIFLECLDHNLSSLELFIYYIINLYKYIINLFAFNIFAIYCKVL